MKYLTYGHQASKSLLMALHLWIRGSVAHWFVPRPSGPRGHGRRRAAARWVPLIIIIVSLIAQALLLWMLGEVIDLCISLMELWAELARKHLELTM